MVSNRLAIIQCPLLIVKLRTYPFTKLARVFPEVAIQLDSKRSGLLIAGNKNGATQRLLRTLKQ